MVVFNLVELDVMFGGNGGGSGRGVGWGKVRCGFELWYFKIFLFFLLLIFI